MAHRASDFEVAREVFLAVELAQQGAATVLIERLTGFSPRWVRAVVRENGGALAMKLKDPVRWLELDLERLMHAQYVVMVYENQPASDRLGYKLLNSYKAYRRVAANLMLLSINECAQIIDLYQRGEAWVRDCMSCQQRHLVLSERAVCPMCLLLEREFCRGCGTELGTAAVRLRSYCETCSPRPVRKALRREAEWACVTVGEDLHSAMPAGASLIEMSRVS